MNTTIRSWFSDVLDDQPHTFWMPLTTPDEYGLGSVWSKFPCGTWSWKNVPVEILDQSFDSGYGAQGVPSFVAWSDDYVYYVHEYDGATSLARVPRNPPRS